MNWLDLFNSDPRNRTREPEFQNFGRFVDENAFGGNRTREGRRRQESFQSGFGGNPPDRQNRPSNDEWIYPQTSEGKSGEVRVRESAGSNGVLQTDDGKALFVQRKKKRDDGTYYWEDVKTSEEAQELLSPFVAQGETNQQPAQPQAQQQQPTTQQDDRGERFEEVSYQPRGARQQDPKVEEVQRTLQSLGYNVDPDGYYGDQTKQAVARFIQDARRDPEMRTLVPSEEQNDGSRVNSRLFNLMQKRAAGPSPYGGRR